MSESKHKLKRRVGVVLKYHGVRYFSEAQYPNAANQVRKGGRRIKGTQAREQDRLANGMIIYLPSVDANVNNHEWKSNRVYLMYFGESVEDVELAIAQLQMFNPIDRDNLLVVYCKGERP